MSTRLLLLIFVFVLLNSCQQEVLVAEDDLYHTWEATTFISVESMAYTKHENKPILLTFNRDGSYYLKLDVNSCTGSYETSAKDSLAIQSPGCTKMCCDSPFSEKLTVMLPRVTTFTIDNNILQLNVPQWGFIELKLKE